MPYLPVNLSTDPILFHRFYSTYLPHTPVQLTLPEFISLLDIFLSLLGLLNNLDFHFCSNSMWMFCCVYMCVRACVHVYIHIRGEIGPQVSQVIGKCSTDSQTQAVGKAWWWLQLSVTESPDPSSFQVRFLML